MVKRLRFPLSAEQLELLLAFESASGLQALARLLAKDPSVVSRNIQRIAEHGPVLSKMGGRWQLTPLGKQVNSHTRNYLNELGELGLPSPTAGKKPDASFAHAALAIVNAQEGLLGRMPASRRPVDAEAKLARVLQRWRTNRAPVFHIRHRSENPRSAFFKDAAGYEFLTAFRPVPGEPVLCKSGASAFAGTTFASKLEATGISAIVLAGFTANECIDATARDAHEAGFTTFVAGDATASIDVTAPDGTYYAAEKIHKLILANIHSHSARVLTTADILEST